MPKEDQNMSVDQKIKPPYVSYTTFKNFLDSLKQLIPARIDGTHPFMVGQSGSTQSFLMVTLKFFGLVDGKAPTEALKTLVQSDGESRREIWKAMFVKAYEPILTGLDLETASVGMIHDKFKAQDLSGDTVSKCYSFFIAGAAEAGLPMAPHLKPGARARGGGQRGKSKRPRNGNPGTPSLESPTQKTQSMKEMLATKFPEFDPKWPDEIKTKWFEGFDQLWKSADAKDSSSTNNN
jgi:hypothetical protein